MNDTHIQSLAGIYEALENFNLLLLSHSCDVVSIFAVIDNSAFEFIDAMSRVEIENEPNYRIIVFI